MYYIDISLFKTFSDDHHRHLYKGVSPPGWPRSSAVTVTTKDFPESLNVVLNSAMYFLSNTKIKSPIQPNSCQCLHSESGGIRNNEGRFPSRSFDFPLPG